MNEKAPVSVLIPCFQCSGTIARAVQSVLAQSVMPAEVILVDDDSQDGTLNILKAIKNQHPGWVNLLELGENSGPSGARNAGWAAATQPYIAFLDADDEWHPKKIEIQLGWMKGHPSVVLTGHRSQVGGPWQGVGKFKAHRVTLLQKLIKSRFSTRSVMLKKDLPFRFNEEKRHSEDYLLWLTVIAKAGEVFVIDAPMARTSKPAYGAAGLSRDLLAMQKGEVDTYQRLKSAGVINGFQLNGLLALSFLKCLRRMFVVKLRKMQNWQ